MAKGLVKTTSYNVNCILNPIKKSKILRKLKKTEVVYVQETHLSEIDYIKLKRMGFKKYFQFPSLQDPEGVLQS